MQPVLRTHYSENGFQDPAQEKLLDAPKTYGGVVLIWGEVGRAIRRAGVVRVTEEEPTPHGSVTSRRRTFGIIAR